MEAVAAYRDGIRVDRTKKNHGTRMVALIDNLSFVTLLHSVEEYLQVLGVDVEFRSVELTDWDNYPAIKFDIAVDGKEF